MKREPMILIRTPRAHYAIFALGCLPIVRMSKRGV